RPLQRQREKEHRLHRVAGDVARPRQPVANQLAGDLHRAIIRREYRGVKLTSTSDGFHRGGAETRRLPIKGFRTGFRPTFATSTSATMLAILRASASPR